MVRINYNVRGQADLNQILRKALNQALTDSVDAIKDILIKEIDKQVYRVYRPRFYKRRKSRGGLSDSAFIQGKLVSDGVLTIRTYAPKNIGYPNSSTEKLLDEIVVSGVGYDYAYNGKYNYEQPRDFYQSTEDILQRGTMKNILVQSLRSAGYEVII